MWTTLNFKGLLKTEKRAGDICKIYRIWTRLASVYSMDSKLKKYFSSFMDFFGKTDSIILLGVESITNLQNLIKIVDAIFEKIGIFLFLRELPLILGVGEN